jgi:hypothetical protein
MPSEWQSTTGGISSSAPDWPTATGPRSWTRGSARPRADDSRFSFRAYLSGAFQEPFQGLKLAADVATYTMPERRTKDPRELVPLEIADLGEACA